MTVAVVFPGQGSQSLRMLSAYAGQPTVAEAVAEVGETLAVDLGAIIEGDEAALNETEFTQPAMLAMGVGVWRAVAGRVAAPAAMAGHSLGEYAALVCAGCLSLAEAAVLVRRRAELMRDAVAGGGMMAILGLTGEAVDAVCAEARQQGESIWAANYNSERQVVVAGLGSSLAACDGRFKERGAKRTVILPMSTPSHCPLLQAAAAALRMAMAEVAWQAAATPVVHTVENADSVIEAMAAQLVQPVRWQDILRRLKAGGDGRVIECGPGKVLARLGKESGLPHVALHDADAIDHFVAEQ